MAFTVPAYTPQEFAPLYTQINSTSMSFVQSVSVDQDSGAIDVKTFDRDWAGVAKGAAMTMVTLKGVVPNIDTDGKVVGGPVAGNGEGFGSAGMVLGGSVGGPPMQMDESMITNLNLSGNAPVSFVISIGQPAAQSYVFNGFIKKITTDVSVDKALEWTAVASGQFSTWA